jgi:tRNA (guanine37-N1)-methyltransferase
MDAVIRQLPGAIKDLSSLDESFATGLLDAPHYTRPEVWRGQPVPEVLLSGHHANIAQWTREKSLEKTFQSRPDMIKIARSLGQLSKKDEAYLEKLS